MIAEPAQIPYSPALQTRGHQPTEEEAELLEYDRTHGAAGPPLEKEAIFGLTGAGSFLAVFLFTWVVFKNFWFGWLGMPGWW